MTQTQGSPRSTKARSVVTALAVAAFAVAVIGYPAAAALDRWAGRDVIILPGRAHDEAEVKQRREEFDDSIQDPEERRRAIVDIYGASPKAETLRVLFVDDAKVVRPAEDASIALLPNDGGHPLQASTAYFAAKVAAVGGILAGAALLLVRRRLR